MRRTASALLAILLSAAPALAQETLADLGADAARVSRGRPDRPLTGPSPDSRSEIIANFLRANHDDATVRDLVLRKDDPSGESVQHLGFGQRIAGLDVYGTYARASFTSRGELLSVVENLVPARTLRPGRVSPVEALTAVLARFYPGTATPDETGAVENTYTYAQTVLFYQPPTVTRVAVPLRGSVLDSGYLVETWDRSNVLRHTIVSGRGEIVFEELRTNFDSYRIFPISPGLGGQQVVTLPADGTASPAGWVATDTTTGNNVDAYLDRDNNGSADTGGRPVASSGQVFDFAWSATQAPTTTDNQMASVTNLFYLNNLLHDRLYGYGFNEAAGNFQTDNFGKGGAGNDSVRAEAQDGGGTNNANFATPADGSRPRMQMYLWNTANPNRDGDLDSDIVYHEYGHGLTWRMIGNMDGPFAGAIGEGMGDTLAIFFNENDALAEYSANNTTGIRRNRYTNYPRTYGNMAGSSVHNDGEIYAATMWRLRENWLAQGRRVEDLLTDIVQGMNYTPSRPQYEDMRDGILQALTVRGASSNERCDVWDAFADYGIGVGANGVESCFGNVCFFGGVTQSFTKPTECSETSNTAPTVTITAPSNGSSFSAGANVTFTGTATDTQDGNLTSTLVWTSSINGPIGSGASFTTSSLSVGTHTITASATDNGGLPGSASITVNITAPGEIQLTVTKSKNKGINVANLSWSGATGANVDIYRNGGSTPHVNTANDGSHVDSTGTKGAQTFTYRVCSAGTCSSTVTVVF